MKLPKLGHFIGGEYTASANGETFINIEPATDEVLAEVPLGGSEDIQRAVDASTTSDWATSTYSERRTVLLRIAELIESKQRWFAELESRDSGKPLSETLHGDIPRAASNFRYFASLLANPTSETFTSDDGSTHTSAREPLGLVGLITPWNLPLYLATWKIAPALAMGNRIILKPAELTPMTAIALGEICNEAGLPPGTFNVVQGLGPSSAGEALVDHPAVQGISFTGETTTGKAIMARAATTLKKVSFELGGKGASVVFGDADLAAAIPTICRAAYRNQGQICLAGSRLIVHHSVHDQVVEELQHHISNIRLGDPLDEQTTMGSLIGRDHRDKVAAYVDLARTESGSEVVTGGKHHGDKGAFYEPTLITGVAQESRLIQEEIFGPVLTVQSFRESDEALAMLNGTPYGLSCSLWTTHEARARWAAAGARMGLVWVNSWFKRNLNTAFGGMKASGVGREGGRYSLDFFSETKTTTWG